MVKGTVGRIKERRGCEQIPGREKGVSQVGRRAGVGVERKIPVAGCFTPSPFPTHTKKGGKMGVSPPSLFGSFAVAPAPAAARPGPWRRPPSRPP